jgi:putative ABC transport system permease protein
MIRFLLKGLLRDRTRSLFPTLTVTAGVMLTVFLHAWLNGAVTGIIDSTARFRTGHVSVMSRAYAAKSDQAPTDLALLGIDTVLSGLRHDYPDMLWSPRILFGGLLDVPDERGETREQAPVSGIGSDLLSSQSPEKEILNLRSAIVVGRLPERAGEILVADNLAQKLRIQPGQKVTLITSTMNGGMSFANFVLAGTVRFGVGPMDRSMVLADVGDVQQALDMENGAGQLLGFFRDNIYHEERAQTITEQFNMHYSSDSSRYAPHMDFLRNQSGLDDYLREVSVLVGFVFVIFLAAMSIVLWNAGLTGSLRRYGEIGLRLAIGEETRHVYWAMMAESVMIGVAGSTLGTLLGVGAGYYLQYHGLDFGAMAKNNTMMITDIIRAQVEPMTYVIGFIPGILATILGTGISGIGIYIRNTSQLFKELET